MAGTRNASGQFVKRPGIADRADDSDRGDVIVDPNTIDAGTPEPEPERTPTGRRKRRDAGIPRPGYSTAATGTSGTSSAKTKTAALDLSAFVGLFVGFHAALAQATDCPPLEISEQQGTEYLRTVQAVLRHYSLESTQKTLDIAALVGATATLYGPAAFYLFARGRQKKEHSQEAPGVINHPANFRVG